MGGGSTWRRRQALAAGRRVGACAPAISDTGMVPGWGIIPRAGDGQKAARRMRAGERQARSMPSDAILLHRRGCSCQARLQARSPSAHLQGHRLHGCRRLLALASHGSNCPPPIAEMELRSVWSRVASCRHGEHRPSSQQLWAPWNAEIGPVLHRSIVLHWRNPLYSSLRWRSCSPAALQPLRQQHRSMVPLGNGIEHPSSPCATCEQRQPSTRCLQRPCSPLRRLQGETLLP